MVADSEVLLITVEVLTALDIGDFSIKVCTQPSHQSSPIG